MEPNREHETGCWPSPAPRLPHRNEEVFASLAEAVIERWRVDYNQRRPHSAHRGLTPEAAHLRSAGPAAQLRPAPPAARYHRSAEAAMTNRTLIAAAGAKGSRSPHMPPLQAGVLQQAHGIADAAARPPQSDLPARRGGREVRDSRATWHDDRRCTEPVR